MSNFSFKIKILIKDGCQLFSNLNVLFMLLHII